MCVHTVPTPVHQLPPRLHPSADGRFHGWLPVLIFLMHFCLGLLASEMALSPGVYSCFLMLWPVPAPWSALELCPQTSLLFSSAPLCGLLNVSISYSQPPPPHCCWKQSLSFLRPNPLQASSDLYARKYTTTVSLSHLLVFFARPGSRKQPEHHLPQGPNCGQGNKKGLLSVAASAGDMRGAGSVTGSGPRSGAWRPLQCSSWGSLAGSGPQGHRESDMT